MRLKMKDLEKILNLKDYKIMSIEDVERDKKKIKIISIISEKNKKSSLFVRRLIYHKYNKIFIEEAD